MAHINVKVEQELYAKFKNKLLTNGLKVNEVVVTMITEYVNKGV